MKNYFARKLVNLAEDMKAKEDNTAKAIHDSIFEAYQVEWQRTRDIESKATGIVGFTGVVFSLIIASLVTIISSANEATKKDILFSLYSQTFIYLILAFMVLSIVYGIMALTVKKWQFLNVYPFVEYCNKIEMNSEQICEVVTEQYMRIIKSNGDQNSHISDLLNTSYYLFIGSIIMLLGLIIYILNCVK